MREKKFQVRRRLSIFCQGTQNPEYHETESLVDLFRIPTIINVIKNKKFSEVFITIKVIREDTAKNSLLANKIVENDVTVKLWR